MNPTLTFADYRERARSTATYDRSRTGLYPMLGLMGETGEAAHKIMNFAPDTNGPRFFEVCTLFEMRAAQAEILKKEIRDKNAHPEIKGLDFSTMTPEQKRDILLELGDVLWYLSTLSEDLGSSLEEVATMNIEKLASRRARDKIQGSGDNR